MSEQALKVVGRTDQASSKKAVEVKDFHLWIGDAHILQNIKVSFPENQITCIIGPSGSGKSSLIRSINRINDQVEGMVIDGDIVVGGKSVLGADVDTALLRGNVGMVFQKPCVFPGSISENVLFGVKHLKKLSKRERLELVEKNLQTVSLWKEVAHRLSDKASSLSIGQQQRLCIARTLAIEPEVILLDEPTSSLDPLSTRAIEEMMLKLKKKFTLVFVSHNIQQARRIADHLVFICEGKIIEQGRAEDVFKHPQDPQTRAYLDDGYCAC